MGAKELTDRLMKAVQLGGGIDWKKAREEVCEEQRKAPTTALRVICLRLHKIVMDAAERDSIAPEDRESFRKARAQDYRLLLVNEAMIGRTDGIVPPDKVPEITAREVREGRLSADDEIHVWAVNVTNRTFPQPKAKKSGGVLATVRSWFG